MLLRVKKRSPTFFLTNAVNGCTFNCHNKGLAKKMKTIRLAFLLMLFSCLSCAYYNTFFNAKSYYRKAYNETRKNVSGNPGTVEISHYEKAIEKSLRLIDLYPESKYVDDALLIAGKSYYYQRDYHKARRKFLELKTNYPNSPYFVESRIWLAKTDIALGQFETATTELNNIIIEEKLNKYRSEVLYHMGKLHERNQDFDRAVLAYEDALLAGPGVLKQDIFFAAGADYDTLNQLDKAIVYYEKLKKLNPSPELQFEASFRIAKITKKQNRVDEAIRLFENLLGDEKYKKWIPNIELEIAECLHLKMKVDEAILAYQDIIQQHQKSEQAAQAYFKMGQLYETVKKEYDRALDAFQLVRTTSGRSVYADSADIKKRDLMRLQALRQVISMARRGENGEVIVADLEKAGTDSLLDHETSMTDSTALDSTEITGIDARDRDGTTGNVAGLPGEKSRGRVFPDAHDDIRSGLPPDSSAASGAKKIAENPELKTFRIEELDKNLLLLGELYLFRFHLPDSAANQYRRLTHEFPESPYAAQALFNLSYIAGIYDSDPNTADSLNRKLIADYPMTRFANVARTAFNLEPVLLKQDSIAMMIAEAENALDVLNDPWASMNIYSNVLHNGTDEETRSKVLYSMAWISEVRLDSVEMAAVFYDSLVHSCPQSPLAQKASLKMRALREPPASGGSGGSQDSTGAASAQAPSLSSGAAQEAASAGLDTVSIPSSGSRKETQDKAEAVPAGGIPAILALFYQKTGENNSTVQGVVVLSVSVDHTGKVIRAVVSRKSPRDAWNQAIEQAVEETHFQPGVRNGKPVATNITLTIPLNGKEELQEQE